MRPGQADKRRRRKVVHPGQLLCAVFWLDRPQGIRRVKPHRRTRKLLFYLIPGLPASHVRQHQPGRLYLADHLQHLTDGGKILCRITDIDTAVDHHDQPQFGCLTDQALEGQ